MKPIECIATIDTEGSLKPVRIKFIENEENIVLSIKSVYEIKKLPGQQPIYQYKCSVIVNGYTKHILLQYDRNSCKWFMI